MYFIQRGIVDVLTKDGTLATSLGDGSHFGGKLVAFGSEVSPYGTVCYL